MESLHEIAKDKGVKMLNEVELVHNNSNRLLRLINQLLDFRKVEDRKFTLRASKTNLFEFSENITNDFKREAKKRNISFKLSSNNLDLELFIDRNLMDKVYFNLLSNAFKFTPDNGKIEITIEDAENKNTVDICFKDSGIGIPEKDMAKVFQAFFKGSNNRKNSSGIGLHLSKEFVEMHKGSIQVKSLHGSEFIVTLYKGQAHFDENEIITEQDLIDTSIIDFTSEYLMDDNYLIQAPTDETEKYSILIVEDNRDLSAFLKNKLQLEYDVYLSDGMDAVEKALETIPDIILCDVNLPDKNGFEICEILKKDLRTSHIPTIILTALGDQESYLKGLQSGADLYLTKPFSYSILIQSIKSLLYNREKLRFYYTSNIHKIEQIDLFGNIEQQFINEMNSLIKDNLGNSDFSVENLAENLKISRVQLYRKVKAIMGISISDYISKIRLEKAKSMLENSSLSISEIAYSTGFSSPNYFSTAFKNSYGTSPGTFRKSIS
ncbi:helix-turn-helix domain-containing protein [Zobellia amurskyensis]|uniref:hybrid sensor histidine kinase/response regulator transcription factor n=1 Tax=Zobellia amurskyensis TaxID=248905 RepID=UPI001F0248D0|nr:helix-turn-helix domain-containing protein [Zobellia amurskyensis]